MLIVSIYSVKKTGLFQTTLLILNLSIRLVNYEFYVNSDFSTENIRSADIRELCIQRVFTWCLPCFCAICPSIPSFASTVAAVLPW